MPNCPSRIISAWCECSSALGIEKVRLTGGEPLLRKGLIGMISEIADMRTAFTADGIRFPLAWVSPSTLP